MAIVLETTLGDITIDLFIKERPRACLNFLKLCKMKYYNFNLFHTIQHDFLAQTGDPTGSGTGGESIWGVLEGPLKRYYEAEDQPKLRHVNVGTVSLVSNNEKMLGSQFFITLAPELVSLDNKHCVFGEVSEGFEVLRKLNEIICDEEQRPYQDVRITHTVILEDPFPDPDYFIEPSQSPEPTAERLQGGRIAADEEVDETVGKSAQELAEMAAEREAKARATILEMVGDIPHADIAPPENVLFVCKLNPVTSDDDLEIIFSRFGKIVSCEVIRDKITGDSLQYAFVEFSDRKACEDAYFKMDNVLIDDRRIHVDFSQSVAKVKWLGRGRVMYYDNDGKQLKEGDKTIGDGNYKKKHNEKNGKYSSHKNNDKNYQNDRKIKNFNDYHRNEKHNRDYDRNRYESKRERQDYYDDRRNRYTDNRDRYRNDKASYQDWKNRTSEYNRDKYRNDNRYDYNSKYKRNTNPRYSRERLHYENKYSSKHDRERSVSNYNEEKLKHRESRSRYEKYNDENRRTHERHVSRERNEEKNKRNSDNKSIKHKNNHSDTSSNEDSEAENKKKKHKKKSSSSDTESSEEEKQKVKKHKKAKDKKKKSKKRKSSSSSSSETDSSESEKKIKETKKCKKRKRHKSDTVPTESSSSSNNSTSSSSSSSDSESDETPKKKHKKR